MAASFNIWSTFPEMCTAYDAMMDPPRAALWPAHCAGHNAALSGSIMPTFITMVLLTPCRSMSAFWNGLDKNFQN